jgi:NhaP-type Na+/H+ or K+/H+ antiporter
MEHAMPRLRFRLRTIMIAIAFIALLLTVVIQGFLLQRNVVRAELARAIAERDRADAAMRYMQAQAALEQYQNAVQQQTPK